MAINSSLTRDAVERSMIVQLGPSAASRADNHPICWGLYVAFAQGFAHQR